MAPAPGINRIVLVHGAAHGAWCWEVLTPILMSYGHEVQTLDLPGLGDDATPPANVHLADYVERIVGILKSRDAPALLLGHSMGGVPVSQAAENAREHVARVVYLTAVSPQSGDSMGSLPLMEHPQSASRALRPSSIEGAVEFDPAMAEEVFYNRCTPDIVRRATARLRPQAAAPIREPVVLSHDRYGRIPKSYIVCTDDQAFPVSAQHWICDRSSIQRKRSIDSDHSPFFSAPHELAKIIHEEASAGDDA
ncbi:alpha/beta fold hydrolase [Terricaulis silvestris]|uniref:Phospholipase YtpA n=1 Tax=Terricaulis silvestris TaxID=2686094 RepID=A0A6I6MRI9_9CAUL|nr:alpha/beta fold hydrolase [Terricaulis silvestris]QGZ93753.1 Phospholipase YtpA [Terricaulis silvestris]